MRAFICAQFVVSFARLVFSAATNLDASSRLTNRTPAARAMQIIVKDGSSVAAKVADARI
jgi:hypothetical protein